MAMELLFLFFARMADMSLATMRHLFVVRGHRVCAAVIGFVEIVIYLLALGLMLQQPHSILRIVVFGLGYATGIIVGSLIEERLALGSRLLQVTVDGSSFDLAAKLRENGCSVTSWRGEGLTGEKHVLHVLVPRRQAGALQKTIRNLAPNAFVIAFEPRRSWPTTSRSSTCANPPGAGNNDRSVHLCSGTGLSAKRIIAQCKLCRTT